MKIALIAHSSVADHYIRTLYNNVDDLSISLYTYDTINNINFKNYINYDYIIFIKFLSIIDWKNIYKFLNEFNPIYCSLKSYWGCGSDLIGIIHRSQFINIDVNDNIPELSSSPDEQLYANLLLKILQLNNFRELLNIKKLDKKLKQLNIIYLNKYIYSYLYPYCRGHYHKNLIAHHTDDIEYFNKWQIEYLSKSKAIFYNNKNYITIIGITFFIICNQHIAVLDKSTLVYWSTKKNSWKKIKSIKNTKIVYNYINKHNTDLIRTLELDV